MDELEEKIAELEMLCLWAEEVKLDRVKPYCGLAKAAIQHEIARVQANRDKNKKGKPDVETD